MRLNVDDRALRDPNINRRLPRFTGLNRFDAIGRLLHVWGLCYDARSPLALIEDVDDRAEHDGFAMAMVAAGCAEAVDDLTIRVRGVEERIGYLKESSAAGHKGAETRQRQVAADGRAPGGRFAKRPKPDADHVSPGVPPGDPWSGARGSDSPALEPHQTSGSSPSPDLSPDLSPDQLPAPPAGLFAADPDPEPARQDPAVAYAAPLVDAINRIRGTPRGYRADALEVVKLCRALLKAAVSPEDALAAVEHRGTEWIASPAMASRVCPASLLALAQVRKTLDDIRAGPPVLRAGPAGTGNHRPLTGQAAPAAHHGIGPIED